MWSMPTATRGLLVRYTLTLSLLLCASQVHAQRAVWPDAPRIIQPGYFECAIPDGHGGAIVALMALDSSGSPAHFLQRVDNSGTPLWGDGVAVPNAEVLSSSSIASDGRSAVFAVVPIVNQENECSILVHRLDMQGRLQWTRTLTRDATPQYPLFNIRPAVLRDGSLVVWFSEYSASGSLYYKVQRISTTGRRLYSENGRRVTPPDPILLSLCVNDKGDVFAATAQHYDPSIVISGYTNTGRIAWRQTIPPPKFIALGSDAKLVPDGDGGVVCLYGYPMTFGSESWWYASRLQRYTDHGRPMWGRSGINPFPATGYEWAARIDVAAVHGSVLVWAFVGPYDIYARKLSLSGKPVWRKDAVICTYPFPLQPDTRRTSEASEAVVDESGNLLLAWEDFRSHKSVSESGYLDCIYAAKVSPTGVGQWTPNGFNVPVVPFPSSYSTWYGMTHFSRMVSDGNGGLLIFGDCTLPGDTSSYLAVQRVVPSDGPPSTPSIRDEGKYTFSLDRLSATLLSTDRAHGIAEYEYAIATESHEPFDVLPWTSNGANPNLALTGLSLRGDKTYYICARARNDIGLWSTQGWSDGIHPVVRTNSLAESLSQPIGWTVLPPPFTVVEDRVEDWLVTDTPGGTVYRVFTSLDANPGDVISAYLSVREFPPGEFCFNLGEVIE